jgi:hypothetical protein
MADHDGILEFLMERCPQIDKDDLIDLVHSIGEWVEMQQELDHV